MRYKTRKEYVNRLTALRWFMANAVTAEAERAITQEAVQVRTANSREHGDVEGLVRARYRCLYGRPD